MATLKWDATGQRKVETGISKGVLYPKGKKGVVWNGLTAVNEKPSGGESVDLYADNFLYASFRTFEKYEATIEAYTYPEEFSECDGSAAISGGVKIGQQRRLPFDFCYRTEILTDVDHGRKNAYKLHMVFNATASPSEKNYETLNESPDATQFSWDIHCSPFKLNGYKASSTIVLDSTTIDRIKMEALEAILYGTKDEDPYMPEPDAIIKLIKRLDLHRVFMDVVSKSGKWVWDTFNFEEDTIPIAIDREAEAHVYNEPESGTEYSIPAIGYSLLSESSDGVRQYMVVVIDNQNPSTYVEDLQEQLNLIEDRVIKSGDLYYYTYTLYV